MGAIGRKSIITKKLQLNKFGKIKDHKMEIVFYDHKEIQIINFETTKLILPRISSMYLKS